MEKMLDELEAEILCHILTCQMLIENAKEDGEEEDIPKYRHYMEAYDRVLEMLKQQRLQGVLCYPPNRQGFWKFA